MTVNFFIRPAALLGLVGAIFLGTGVCNAQYGGTGSESRLDKTIQQDGQKNKTPEPSGKKEKINKAEVAAYNAFVASRTGEPAAHIQLGEDFAAKYPMSKYLDAVYGALTTAYFSTGATDKMFTTGAKAIELNPDNVDVLALLAMAIPRRVKPTTPDGAQQLKNAEMYAHHAIELIPNMAKPAEADDAFFEKAKNDKLSLSHSGLGLMDYNNKKYEDARTELTLAVQLASSPDPVDYFLLGNADSSASYYHDAVAAYQKCADSGPLTVQCKARMATAQHDAETKLGR